MKDFLRKIKEHFQASGLRRADFWVFFAVVLAVVGIVKGSFGVLGVTLLPTFLAGFYLANDSWDDGDDDGGEPEFKIDPEWDDEYGKVA